MTIPVTNPNLGLYKFSYKIREYKFAIKLLLANFTGTSQDPRAAKQFLLQVFDSLIKHYVALKKNPATHIMCHHLTT